MNIEQISLFHLKIPLKFSFKTAQTSLQHRHTLIIKVSSGDFHGYGEVVAFTEPFYTNETISSATHILTKNYIPTLLKENLNHPFDIHNVFNIDSPMALAGFENALLDLYARSKGQNIIEMLFDKKLNTHIDVGLVFGDMPYEELESKVQNGLNQGCQRFKFKIFPQSKCPAHTTPPLEKLKKIRQKFPHISMLADANASFSINKQDFEELKQYNELNLLCIEEAFYFESKQIHNYSAKDFNNYKNALTSLKFKICHDESLLNCVDLQKAFEENILQMLNIKIGRLGGLYYAKKMIDYCTIRDIPYFIGSMVESGISKILHVQLCALGSACMAGDLSDSQRYFEQDLILPEITSQNGKISVPNGAGLGVEVNEELFNKFLVNAWEFNP